MERVRTVGCLLIPRFPLACELADRPDLRGQPAAVAHPETPIVWFATTQAAHVGVRPQQTLKEAQERCPNLVIFDARPALYDEIAAGVLSAVENTFPIVEPIADAAGAYVDMDGLAWFPTAGALNAALLACAPARLEPRLGIASGKFFARVAAEEAHPGEVVSVECSAVCEFLAPRSVDLLPLSDETRRRLRVIGITTIGDLARLPRRALLAQFGTEGVSAWTLAHGGDTDPVQSQPPQERVVEQITFTAPLISREVVLATMEQALIRCLRNPELGEHATRRVVLRMETENQLYWTKAITLKEATADRQKLWHVIRSVVTEADIGGAVMAVTLELAQLTPRRGWQVELLPTPKQRSERLEEGLRLLKGHFGYCPVSRLVVVEPWSRIPERRLALIDFDP